MMIDDDLCVTFCLLGGGGGGGGIGGGGGDRGGRGGLFSPWQIWVIKWVLKNSRFEWGKKSPTT